MPSNDQFECSNCESTLLQGNGSNSRWAQVTCPICDEKMNLIFKCIVCGNVQTLDLNAPEWVTAFTCTNCGGEMMRCSHIKSQQEGKTLQLRKVSEASKKIQEVISKQIDKSALFGNRDITFSRRQNTIKIDSLHRTSASHDMKPNIIEDFDSSTERNKTMDTINDQIRKKLIEANKDYGLPNGWFLTDCYPSWCGRIECATGEFWRLLQRFAKACSFTNEQKLSLKSGLGNERYAKLGLDQPKEPFTQYLAWHPKEGIGWVLRFYDELTNAANIRKVWVRFMIAPSRADWLVPEHELTKIDTSALLSFIEERKDQ